MILSRRGSSSLRPLPFVEMGQRVIQVGPQQSSHHRALLVPQRIPFPQRLQSGCEAGPIVEFAGGGIFIEIAEIEAGGEQSVALHLRYQMEAFHHQRV